MALFNKKEKEKPKTDKKEEIKVPSDLVAKTDIEDQNKKEQKQDKKKKKKKKRVISKQEQYLEYQKESEKKLKGKKNDFNRAKYADEILNYDRIFPDGVCEVREGLLYSKTIEFKDMNYQLISEEDQKQIFLKYCELINLFDSNVAFSITIKNKLTDFKELEDQTKIPMKNDKLDLFRQEYNDIINSKIKEGHNIISKRLYLTFSVKATDYNDAKMHLNRIQDEIIKAFDGVYNKRNKSVNTVKVLNGSERIELLDSIVNPEYHGRDYSYENLMKQNMNSKELIATSFTFDDKSTYKAGNRYGRVLYAKNYPKSIKDSIISEITELPIPLTITFHLQGIPQEEALKNLDMNITLMNTQKLNELQKLLPMGGGEEMVSMKLQYNLQDAQDLREELNARNQRMFLATLLIETSGRTEEELADNVFQITSIGRRNSFEFTALDYEQKAGFGSVLPLGFNLLNNSRTLTTTATGIFIPFKAEELFEKTGFYYGLNAITKNLIYLDRRTRINGNGFILGTPGSGKSFGAKREIVNVILNTDDDVIVIDPEAEYGALTSALGGEVVKLSLGSKTHINPLDINFNQDSEDGDPISNKSDYMLSFMELIAGEGYALDGSSKSILDRSIKKVYEPIIAGTSEVMPTLKDLYNVLRKQGDYAYELATILEMYAIGSLDIFSHRSNININNRFTIFDIRDLGESLKPLGLLVTLNHVWNKVVENRKRNKRTWIYIDEIYLLFASKYSSNFLYTLYKRARKYYGIITGITQNVEDMLRDENVRSMLNNAESYVLLFNQASTDRQIVAEALNISENELTYIKNSGKGRGLLITEGEVIPFVDQFPKNTKLYEMMTTDPNEIKKLKEGKKIV